MIVWSFLAGFSEKLVANILNARAVEAEKATSGK